MRILILILALAVCGCGDGGREPSSHDRMFDAQRRGLEKAEGVNDKIIDGAERLRAEEEEQSK